MDAYQFTKWMDHFIHVLREKEMLTSSYRHLLILDEYKAHLILDVVTKENRHGIDSLPYLLIPPMVCSPLIWLASNPSKWLLEPTYKHGMLNIMVLE